MQKMQNNRLENERVQSYDLQMQILVLLHLRLKVEQKPLQGTLRKQPPTRTATKNPSSLIYHRIDRVLHSPLLPLRHLSLFCKLLRGNISQGYLKVACDTGSNNTSPASILVQRDTILAVVDGMHLVDRAMLQLLPSNR